MKKFLLLILISVSTIHLSAQLTFDNTCTIAFDDISATGTALTIGDDGEANITIPFAFTLDGVSSSDLRVGDNGGVLFNATTGNISTSATPTAQGFYIFADDMDSDYGAILWETLGTAPNRRVVIMWDDRPSFSNTPSGGTFEIILHETSNEITFLYQDTDFGPGDASNDGASAGIRVVGANGANIYSTNTALAGVTCINWTIPSCLPPSALNTSNIQATSADLNWTISGTAGATYNWEVQTQGTAQGTVGAIASGSGVAGATINTTGLTAATSYDFFVQSDCGGTGTSSWIGPISFTTACATETPDYTEDFITFLDLCWEEAGAGDIASGPSSIGTGDWRDGTSLATNSARINLFSNVDREWLLSPNFDLSAGGYEVVLDVAVTNWNSAAADAMGSDDFVTLAYTEDGTTWTVINTWTVADALANTLTTFNFPLASTGVNVRFGILASDGAVNDAEDYDFHVDNFMVRTPPTCLVPTMPNATGIMTTSADLNWTISGTAGATYNWEVQPSGTAQGTAGATASGTGVAGATVNATGLSSNTSYDFFVQSDCGGSGTSVWTVASSFTTQTLPVSVPYVQDFESGTTTDFALTAASEAGLSLNTGSNCTSANSLFFTGGAAGGFTGGSTSATATNAWVDNTTHHSSADLVVDATAVTAGLLLDFSLKQEYSYGANYSWFRVLINGTQIGSDFNPTTQNADPCASQSLDISAYIGTTFTITFQSSMKYTDANGNGGQGDNAYLDDINIYEVTCNPATALNATGVTATSANLNWTVSATAGATYNWEVQPSGTAQGTAGATASGSGVAGATVNATGFTAETAYDFFVQSDCGGSGTSSWVGPVSFTTPCATETPDYTEDFTTFLNPCWEEAGAGDVAAGPSSIGAGDWRTGGNTLATNSARINLFGNTDQEWLLSPNFDLSVGGYEVVLDVAVTNWNSAATDVMGSDDFVTLAYTEDGTTWTAINTWTVADALANTLTSFNFPLASTGANVRFGILASDGAVNDAEDYDFHVDNFIVRTPPSCATPTVLTTANLTTTSVDLGWTEAGTATSWQISYGATSFTAGSGTEIVTATNPHNLSALSGSTSYDWYVRAICGAADTSAWSGVNSFTTPCNTTETPNYTEDFTTFLNPCWEEAGAGDVASGPSSLGAGDWRDGTSLATNSARINLFSNNDQEWLLSPNFDLTVGGYEVALDVAVTNWNSAAADAMGPDDFVTLAYTEDGTTWNAINTWTATDALANTLTTFRFPLASTGSSVRFGILASDGAVNDPEDYDFHVDNFIVRTLPSFVWTGATNTDWNTATNWSDGVVPSSSDDISIPDVSGASGNDPVITPMVTLGDITIAANASLDVLAGIVLDGTFTNNGTVTLKSSATGTGYLDDFTNAGASYVGDITVQRFVNTGSGLGQRFFGTAVASGPVSGLDMTYASGYPTGAYITPDVCGVTLALGSAYSNLFHYEQANVPAAGCDQLGWFALAPTTALEVGRGYSGWMNDGSVLSVTGAPNTGNIDFVTSGVSGSGVATADGWHLLSNPYPSPLNANAYISAGFTSPQTYDGGSGPFHGTFNPVLIAGNELAIMQGFYAENTGGSATASVTNADRIASNTTAWFSTSTLLDQMLTINVTGNGYADKTNIFYADNSLVTSSFDDYTDCKKRASDLGQPTIYSSMSNDMMALNGFPTSDMGTSVPFGVAHGTDGNFELSFEGMTDFPANTTMYVEDKQLGVYHNIANGNYAYSALASDNSDRFELHFVLPVELATLNANCAGDAGKIELVSTNGLANREFVVTEANNTLATGALNTLDVEVAEGTYTVTINDAFGGNQVYTVTVEADEAIEAIYTVSSIDVQVGELVSFNNLTTNATSVEWTIGNITSINGVNNATYTFDEVGTYEIVLNVASDDCADVKAFTVNVSNKSTSISTLAKENAIKVYSDRNVVVLEFLNSFNENAIVEVQNVLGQKVFAGTVDASGTKRLSIKDVTTGHYFVSVKVNGQTMSSKVLLSNN